MNDTSATVESLPKPEPMKLSRRRGRIRHQKILETARGILVKEGFTNMSLRNVAQQMGISHGNLTYYFPNKEDLLSAVIESMLKRNEEEFQAAAASFPDDPKSRITAFFIYLINEAKRPNIENFFFQLWALASHNEIVAELRDKVYRHYLAQVLIHLELIHPEEDSMCLKNKALILMGLLEGMYVMYSLSADFMNQFSNNEEQLLQQVMDIAYSTNR